MQIGLDDSGQCKKNDYEFKKRLFKEIMMNFEELFKEISTKELCDNFNVFTLVGEDFYAITAGKENQYNSMIGSGGGLGLLFKKPTTWCLIKQDLIRLK